MRPARARDGVAVFLLGLALVYGLVASGLIVECLPGDGRCLVELIGNDPCFLRLDEAAVAGMGSHLDGNGCGNHCVDLSLDHNGITPAISVIHVSSIFDSLPLPPAVSDSGASPSIWAIAALFKRARESVPQTDLDLHLHASLRI